MTVKQAGSQNLGVVYLTRGGIKPGDQAMINKHPLLLKSKRSKKKGR